MAKFSSIIIGNGEIGSALHKIVGGEIIDKKENRLNILHYDILHICFGYSEEFVSEVNRYQDLHSPKFTVIHSTVPVGTSRRLGAIHSPCIGQHPFLEEGIRTFPKMLGGEQASELADYFRRKGLKVVLFDKQETTEASKLFLTEYYRECIEFAQRVKDYCDKNSLNFSEVYRLPNQIYNEGYKKLGQDQFVRPILEPIMREIGGHCVMPNKELIKLSE